MAKLTTGARASLPKKAFAGPGRTFPIPDKKHAKAAILDAPKAVKAGTITPAQKTAIDQKAKSKMGNMGNFGGKAAKPFGAKAEKAEPSAPKPSPKGKPEMVANRVVGMMAPEDKGHMLPGKPGHYNYK